MITWSNPIMQEIPRTKSQPAPRKRQYTKLRDEYVAITGDDLCAALVLELFGNTDEYRRKHGRELWVGYSQRSIKSRLRGEWGDRRVAKTLDKLVALGLLLRRKKPGAGKALEHRFNPDKVEAAVNEWLCPNETSVFIVSWQAAILQFQSAKMQNEFAGLQFKGAKTPVHSAFLPMILDGSLALFLTLFDSSKGEEFARGRAPDSPLPSPDLSDNESIQDLNQHCADVGAVDPAAGETFMRQTLHECDDPHADKPHPPTPLPGDAPVETVGDVRLHPIAQAFIDATPSNLREPVTSAWVDALNELVTMGITPDDVTAFTIEKFRGRGRTYAFFWLPLDMGYERDRRAATTSPSSNDWIPPNALEWVDPAELGYKDAIMPLWDILKPSGLTGNQAG